MAYRWLSNFDASRGGRGRDSGQGLVEMVISLDDADDRGRGLIAVMVAGAIALQRTDQKGTALTLADKQLELYRTFAYPNIRLVTPAARRRNGLLQGA